MIKILLLVGILSSIGILGNTIVSLGQNTTETNKIDIESSSIDITKIIQDNEPSIKVEYQSNSMVV